MGAVCGHCRQGAESEGHVSRRPLSTSEADRQSVADEIDDEFALHIQLTAQDLQDEGLSPTEARREAMRRFGRAERIKRDCMRVGHGRYKSQRRAAAIMKVIYDIRYALRAFGKSPAFFLTTIGTLGLGIGASTTIFSVVDTVVLRPLPYADASRIVQLGTRWPSSNRLGSVSPMNFSDWREQNDVFESMIASRTASMALTAHGAPETFMAAGVSAGFFEMLGYSPFIGRGILLNDDRVGGNRVVVLRHGAWKRRWGGDGNVIGRTITLRHEQYTIVGVMPEDFHPPEAIYHNDVEMWFPLAFVDDDLTERDNGFLQVIGKLKPGVSLEQSRQSLNTLQQNIYERIAAPSETMAEWRAGQTVQIEPLHERTVGTVRANLMVFFGAVALLLFIACANVANLFLARALDREREIALRLALGASRSRIMQQLLTESMVTAVVGGILGGALAFAGVRAFTAFAPDGIPRVSEVTVDLRVLAFAGLISVVTGLLFGLAPVYRHRCTSASEALKEGALTTTAGRRRNLLRNSLVVSETAIALLLLTGAGLLINSFVRLINVDPGFNPNGVARLELYIQDYETGEQRAAFFDELVTRLAGLPGITSAAATDQLPMTGNRSATGITVRGHEPSDNDPPWVTYRRITARYFETLQIDVLRGRSFSGAEHAGTERVAVINDALANHYWSDGDAVGGHLKFGGPDSEDNWYTVVGVVSELNQHGLGQSAGPALYIPHRRSPFVFGNVVVRVSGDLTPVIAAMRLALWDMDPNLPIQNIGTLRSQMSQTVAEPRFYTILLVTFAAVAVVLAAVGIYGTISYTVGQRTQEVGIRMALGATAKNVYGLVVRHGMTLSLTGIAIGIGGALFMSRALERFVFGIGTTDLPTYAIVGAALGLVALIACLIPARRATRVDPMTALRVQ